MGTQSKQQLAARFGLGALLSIAALAAGQARADEANGFSKFDFDRAFDRSFSNVTSPARTTPSPADMLEAATSRPGTPITALPDGTDAALAPSAIGIGIGTGIESQAAPIGSGIASYYGAGFAGRRTASGDVFDPGELTAAHRSLPFGSRVRVTNARTGASVVVRINDRGPYHGNRVIDLSRAAASEIGLVGPGSGEVQLALLAG